jgi:hypothetical protein
VRYPSFARCMRASSGRARTALPAVNAHSCTRASSGRSSAWLALACARPSTRNLNLACALRSAAVLGYALESFVDVWSSVLVLYRFWDDRVEPEAARQRERRASFGISLTVRAPFWALCPGVVWPAGTPNKASPACLSMLRRPLLA